MLLDKMLSCLLLVDVQEKLAPLIHSSERLLARCDWMMRLALELKIPILACEQYPQGLGVTVAPLKKHLSSTPVAKMHFSCHKSSDFRTQLSQINKKQIVIIGIETHVCVLQTALDLKKAGSEVYVVIDAVGSRNILEHQAGLNRMQQAGVILITAEMAFFEWVEQSGLPEFKQLSQTFFPR